MCKGCGGVPGVWGGPLLSSVCIFSPWQVDPSLRLLPQITELFIICGFCFVLFCFVCCCYLAWQVTPPFAPSLRSRNLSSSVVFVLFCFVLFCLLLLFSMAGDHSLRPFPQTTAPFISCGFVFYMAGGPNPSPLPSDVCTFHQFLCFFHTPLPSVHGTFHQLLLLFSTRPFPQTTALFINCCCCFSLRLSLGTTALFTNCIFPTTGGPLPSPLPSDHGTADRLALHGEEPGPREVRQVRQAQGRPGTSAEVADGGRAMRPAGLPLPQDRAHSAGPFCVQRCRRVWKLFGMRKHVEKCLSFVRVFVS